METKTKKAPGVGSMKVLAGIVTFFGLVKAFEIYITDPLKGWLDAISVIFASILVYLVVSNIANIHNKIHSALEKKTDEMK